MSYSNNKKFEGKKTLIDSARGQAGAVFVFIWEGLRAWEHSINKTLTIFPKLKRNKSPA